ncbi:hypothetical protein CNY89_19275 [Amaricoccus sp. HAR-UPW-R2A-40]|nr:hypothetical protein CNY89_19275 [Amaricoccus sp. HAR-UPW-R2A-40]
MLFDPRRYLRMIEQEERNQEMRGVEGPPRAIRAIRAIPTEPLGAISTFSTDPAPIADPDALLTLLRERGPMTYGAAATALGWGATRAWQAEAALRAAGRVEHDRFGRAALNARAGE